MDIIASTRLEKNNKHRARHGPASKGSGRVKGPSRTAIRFLNRRTLSQIDFSSSQISVFIGKYNVERFDTDEVLRLGQTLQTELSSLSLMRNLTVRHWSMLLLIQAIVVFHQSVLQDERRFRGNAIHECFLEALKAKGELHIQIL